MMKILKTNKSKKYLEKAIRRWQRNGKYLPSGETLLNIYQKEDPKNKWIYQADIIYDIRCSENYKIVVYMFKPGNFRWADYKIEAEVKGENKRVYRR